MNKPEPMSAYDDPALQAAASTDHAASDAEAEKEFSRGLNALQERNSVAALALFERAFVLGTRPAYFSYLGFCVAKERGQFKKGISLCREALEKEPANPVHYLNLGRIHLVTGNKEAAIAVFREGLSHGPNQEIAGLLNVIGTRQKPVITSLGRNHPINRSLGKLLSKLGLR
jgi:Flp pilus assembly protein TadD